MPGVVLALSNQPRLFPNLFLDFLDFLVFLDFLGVGLLYSLIACLATRGASIVAPEIPLYTEG